MQLLDWLFLDALQTGALAALFISFGTDAISRRDRMMGWLALTCLLIGLRHTVLALGSQPMVNADLVDRIQSLLATCGFISLCAALARLFPNQVPKPFPAWVALGMAPNFFRNLALPHPSLANTWLHHGANLTYLVGCGFIVYWTLKARQEDDPMGRRLFLGFLGVTLPVVVEISALSLFDLKVRLSGFSLMILAMAIGTSWQWLVVTNMEAQIQRAENEVDIWRSLVPGNAFRTDQPSPTMENLFGAGWAERIRTLPDASLIGADGVTYRINSRAVLPGERAGWYERDEDTQAGLQGLLAGWTVGLGLDDPSESLRLQSLLRAWGAEVQIWGTVPPREGPYPSILLWAREPSILSVWRENDLLRRRPRWVQIGGPITEGPHARMEPGATQESMRVTLEGLLSWH